MSFRGNQNRSRNYGSANFGAPMGGNRMGGGMGLSPWEGQNPGPQFGNNMRQGGGQGINNANMLNNFLNLLRNQPPSLLDLPRGGIGGNRNQRGGPIMNRGNAGGPGGNRQHNRRSGGGGAGGSQGSGGGGGQGFPNRSISAGGSSNKSAQKQGTGGGIRKQNSFERAKKVLAKNNTANANKKKDNAANNASLPAEKKVVESTATTTKESPYASVPNDMFYCHLCKKHMWDANSFENHIKGRTHLMMREGIEESYRLKANMIRQEAKIAEQLKAIELDRLKRMGKSKQRQLDYCTMCDLNFHGHISSHRKSDGHLRLKKFLHPRCIECNREFATRIDFDSHVLSAEHLIMAAKRNFKVGERKRETLPIISEEEELRDVRQPQKKKKQNAKAAAAAAAAAKEGGGTEEGADGEAAVTTAGEEADGEGGEGEADGTEDGAKEEGADGEAKEQGGEEAGAAGTASVAEEEPEFPIDPEDVIVDFQDGDDIPPEIEARLPKYNCTRPVGAALIAKIECYECSICGKFLDTEKTVEVHTRTQTHYRNFLKLLNEKANDTKIAQKRAAAALEESERKKRKLEEAAALDNESKKTKLDDESVVVAATEAEESWDGVENDAQTTAAASEGGDEAEDNTETATDLYDPSEATGEDEDVEMVENGGGEEAAEGSEQNENAEGEDVDGTANGEAVAAEKVANEKEVKAETPVKKAPAEAVTTPAAVETTVKPAEKTAVPTTPVAQQTPPKPTPSAPKPAETTPTPVKKAAQTRNTATRGTPRGRGRGRYNRY